MTSMEIAALIGATIALLGALQAWLVSMTVKHSNALNGLMPPRIAAGADVRIAADHVAREETATPVAPADPSPELLALRARLHALGQPTPHP